MHLLFLNHNYRYSGTYYRAMPMAEQLVRRGHHVTLMTVSPGHRWRAVHSEVRGVNIIETPNWGQENSGGGYGPLDNGYRCIHTLLRNYDIIHAFDHKPNATFAGFLGRLKGARLVVDWADWWGGPGGINDVPRRIPAIGRFEAWWEEKSKLWADGVVTISQVLYERALKVGCPAERTLYLPTGAPVERIHPLPVAQARQELGIPLTRKIAGFIGCGQGELDIVMQSLQQLPDLWLMVIGPKHPRVSKLAVSLGVADRLLQTGFVPDDVVAIYLACADVMVLPMADRPADRGRLPNKLLDYMAAGRPVVASPVGEVNKILSQHQIGLLAERDNFAEAIHTLLTDIELRDEMGRQARHVAETAFAWPQMIDRLERFYLDCIG